MIINQNNEWNKLLFVRCFTLNNDYLNSFRNRQEKNTDIASPPGYNPQVALAHNTEHSRDTDSNHLIIKKSWDLALGPLKQVPMNLFIMYMAGNSISIFPIMMVGMLIIRPVKALFTLQQSECKKYWTRLDKTLDNLNRLNSLCRKIKLMYNYEDL